MILWNVSPKKIEARYDGRVMEFAPNEQKKIYDPNVFNHLYFKLKSKGLVLIDEEKRTEETDKNALLEGLKARWKGLDFIVRNYRTMNKDREANKLAADAPSEAVMDAAEEAQEILDRLKELEGDRFKKVDAYLNDDRVKKMAEDINKNTDALETKGSFETELKGRRPGRPRNVAVPANNP